MGNAKSNYPPAKLDSINGQSFVGTTINSLKQLAELGKPGTVEELKQRFDDFFAFCSKKNLRPGCEQLALSCGVSREMFWKWCKGEGCSFEWSEACRLARQLISAFIEQMTFSGHLNPPVGIFALKNIAGWKDVVEYEPIVQQKRLLTAEELPRLDASMLNKGNNAEHSRKSAEVLPRLGNNDGE